MQFAELDPDALRSGACQVWWAAAGWGRRRVALLAPAELARREALRRPEDRDRFTTACALLRLLVGGLLRVPPAEVPVVRRCPRCGGPHGKPHLPPGPGWTFSVSHADDRVGVALAHELPVGLDVEPIAPHAAADLAGLLTEPERHALAEVGAAERDRAALQLWVRREALVKATGDGLRADLTTFSVGAPFGAPRADGEVGSVPASRLSLVDLQPGDGYVGSLAAIGAPTSVAEVRLPGRAGDPPGR